MVFVRKCGVIPIFGFLHASLIVCAYIYCFVKLNTLLLSLFYTGREITPASKKRATIFDGET